MVKYHGQWRGLLAPSRLEIRQSGPILNAILASLPDRYRQNPSQTLVDLAEKVSSGEIVDINGKAHSVDDVLLTGQNIFIFRLPADHNAPVDNLQVLWRGKAAMVVDKPAGISTIPRGKYVARSVVYQARKQFDNPSIVAAHRLDKLTSGCLLLVMNPDYRGDYQLLFEKRAIKKRYLAVTKINENSDFIIGQNYCWYLAMRKRVGSLQVQVAEPEILQGSRGKKQINSGNGQESQKMLRRWRDTETRAWLCAEKDGHWLWELEPRTGFTHQLRAAMSHQGVPILGDPLYPKISEDMGEDTAKFDLSLCAWKLAFQDPVDNIEVAVESNFTPNLFKKQ